MESSDSCKSWTEGEEFLEKSNEMYQPREGQEMRTRALRTDIEGSLNAKETREEEHLAPLDLIEKKTPWDAMSSDSKTDDKGKKHILTKLKAFLNALNGLPESRDTEKGNSLAIINEQKRTTPSILIDVQLANKIELIRRRSSGIELLSKELKELLKGHTFFVRLCGDHRYGNGVRRFYKN
jgi:hypothetical protein